MKRPSAKAMAARRRANAKRREARNARDAAAFARWLRAFPDEPDDHISIGCRFWWWLIDRWDRRLRAFGCWRSLWWSDLIFLDKERP